MTSSKSIKIIAISHTLNFFVWPLKKNTLYDPIMHIHIYIHIQYYPYPGINVCNGNNSKKHCWPKVHKIHLDTLLLLNRKNYIPLSSLRESKVCSWAQQLWWISATTERSVDSKVLTGSSKGRHSCESLCCSLKKIYKKTNIIHFDTTSPLIGPMSGQPL